MDMLDTPSLRSLPRREALLAGVAASATLAAPAASAAPRTSAPAARLAGNTLTTRDGTTLYYKDWGSGPVVVFSHGYPLSSDAWESQMLFLSQHGYRVIAHDRRGFGRSSQPATGYDYDTFADDLAQLIEALDLKDVTLVGHSMGGGEVARYIGRHGEGRVRKAALVAAVPPFMLKTPGNPGGIPKDALDGMRAAVVADRSQWFKDVTMPYFNFNRPNARISEGERDSFWRQGMATGMLASYYALAAFSETDFTADLRKFTVPTLIVHGDDDQITPLELTGKASAGIVKHAKLLVYAGASHGIPMIDKERLNRDLLAFLES